MPESQEKIYEILFGFKVLNLLGYDCIQTFLKHNHTWVNDAIAPLHFIVGLCLSM
jgi:hypothetical protein